MAALVIAEHDNASLKASTLNTVTAAVQCSNEVHILIAGNDCAEACAAAAQIAGVTKVLLAEGAQFADGRQPDILDVMAAAMRSEEPVVDRTAAAAVDMFRRLIECDEATMRLLRWRLVNPTAPLLEYAATNGLSVRTVARKIKAIETAWPAAGRILNANYHG
jgi:hypothetical protein